MNSQDIDTRLRILNAAQALFAHHGFEGTSIRDLAKKAQVNVAAVNYHFENKQMLYSEVIKENCDWLDGQIRDLALETFESTAHFAQKIFSLFLNNPDQALNSFKLILGSSLPLMEQKATNNDISCSGPPGGKYLLMVIEREVGTEVSTDAKFWAMRAIFSQIVHLGVISATAFGHSKAREDKRFNAKNLSHHIFLLTQAVIEHIKRSPDGEYVK